MQKAAPFADQTSALRLSLVAELGAQRTQFLNPILNHLLSAALIAIFLWKFLTMVIVLISTTLLDISKKCSFSPFVALLASLNMLKNPWSTGLYRGCSPPKPLPKPLPPRCFVQFREGDGAPVGGLGALSAAVALAENNKKPAGLDVALF